MLKLNQAEMHLLVVICTNPHNPHVQHLLSDPRLSGEARAIAILVLRSFVSEEAFKRMTKSLPVFEADPATTSEIEEAAKTYSSLAKARRAERADLRAAQPISA